jgi:hypothetical protein
MAMDLPQSERELCSHSTIARLENFRGGIVADMRPQNASSFSTE